MSTLCILLFFSLLNGSLIFIILPSLAIALPTWSGYSISNEVGNNYANMPVVTRLRARSLRTSINEVEPNQTSSFRHMKLQVRYMNITVRIILRLLRIMSFRVQLYLCPTIILLMLLWYPQISHLRHCTSSILVKRVLLCLLFQNFKFRKFQIAIQNHLSSTIIFPKVIFSPWNPTVKIAR